MKGNELYYDGNRLPLNTAIPNFDPSLLAVKFIGINSRTFAFDYYFQDNAAAADESPATYEAGWNDPLPVEWLDFELTLNTETNAINITWSTAQEDNNSHFVVYRSETGETFKEVGMVQGKGTYLGVSSYSFTDQTVVNGTTYYYKVAQVDFDGKSSETDVLPIQTTINHNVIPVYPNPFVGSLDIDLNKVRCNQVVIKDLAGRVMYQTINEGNRDSHISVNTNEWPTGMYFLTIVNGDTQITKKIIRH